MPLSICVYGSSSKQTPKAYLDAATTLGTEMAVRGHTCVNGAGAHGVMGALNRAGKAAGGKVIGVCHKMFVDGEITAQFEGLELVLTGEAAPVSPFGAQQPEARPCIRHDGRWQRSGRTEGSARRALRVLHRAPGRTWHLCVAAVTVSPFTRSLGEWASYRLRVTASLAAHTCTPILLGQGTSSGRWRARASSE